MVERLSNVLGSSVEAYFVLHPVWPLLTDAQKLELINTAQSEIAARVNIEGLYTYLTTEDIVAEEVFPT